MRFVRSLALAAAAASCVGSLTACGPVNSITIGRGGPPYPGPSHPPVVVDDDGDDQGPPPWAPAHGYRRKHQRAYQSREQTVDLVFDSNVGVYVVVGIPNYYYWNGVYLRIDSGSWWQAPYLDARWAPCVSAELPAGLRYKQIKKYQGPPKGHRQDEDHGRGRGHGHGHGHDDDDEQ
ncbi:MAG: hypothetical protein E6J87_06765 [Deltaproteobacteria bacterium]|nr:MAG: hypothetical protein E6J87_06765 [Deltaproteobacteria bacterium]